jgi:hypothetical protein
MDCSTCHDDEIRDLRRQVWEEEHRMAECQSEIRRLRAIAWEYDRFVQEVKLDKVEFSIACFGRKLGDVMEEVWDMFLTFHVQEASFQFNGCEITIKQGQEQEADGEK